MARPYVLKPVNEGPRWASRSSPPESTTATRSAGDVEGPRKHFDSLLAEPSGSGHELTVAVLNDEALAVTELKPKVGSTTMILKYTDGLTEHVFVTCR